MIWLAWRQFRTQALVALGLLAAFAVLVLVTGLHMRDVYGSLGGTQCAPHDCIALNTHAKVLVSLIPVALLATPALLGMFWGAPLLARELESGTYRLAWTQSVTRGRWLLTKVALVGVAALLVAGLTSWLVSWWFAPLDAVDMNRFDAGVFAVRGIVAIGYAGFAFALGVAAGAVARRTLPAMAATLFGFIAARIAFTLWVRPHLLAGKHSLIPLTQGEGVGFLANRSSFSLVAGAPTMPNAWTLSSVFVNQAHQALSAAKLQDLLVRTCPAIGAGLPPNPGPGTTKNAVGLAGGQFESCLQALSHHVQLLVTYQPPNHYWPMQIIETAIFLAAAGVLIWATVWRVSRRGPRRPVVGESRPHTVDRFATEHAPEIGVRH